MYVPQQFRVDDLVLIEKLITENSFGTLVSVVDGVPFATHLPLLFSRDSGKHGVLRGHVARANPHWRSLEAETEVLTIFQGAHGYISPSWYLESPAVPTWDYMVVHVYGTPRIATQQELLETLRQSVLFYEQNSEAPWLLEGLPGDYIQKMASGVVGFEIEVTRIEGKFKLSQNRSREDILSVVDHLRQDSDNPGLADVICQHAL